MKFRDMLRMSSSSLLKRKIRTFLTVLGVVIGTASIVVMISLGLGLTRASLAEIEQYGGLTTVTVTEQDIMGGGMSSVGTKKGNKVSTDHLNDKVVDEIKQIEHVKDVYPILETDAMVLCGGFQANITLRGISADKMSNLNLKFENGGLPASLDQLQMIYGNMVIGDFYNEKSGQGYWYNGQKADIDLMNDTLMYVFDTEKYYNFVNGGTDEKGQPYPRPKKHIIPTAGVIAGGIEEYNSNSYYVYCDLDNLKSLLKKEFKNSTIPGQPTTISGKPYKEIYYTSIIVNVDKMDNVQQVQNEVNNLGYMGTSNAEWVQSMQGQYKYIQLALGGIGAVSLIVAAIGIANTMMMSIYERTKEIGIMKVLGCDMKNIQVMFLLEAGYIGFIGGVAGVALSYGISSVINTVVKNMNLEVNVKVGLSYIPIWLALLSICFAVLVGMIAGFFPSLRAMKLSPLAAIRNE